MSIHTSVARPRRRFSAAVCGVSAIAIGACAPLDDSSNNNRYGSITLRATGSAQQEFPITPTAVFFTGGQTDLPTSATTVDQCSQAPFFGEQISPGNIVAGSPLTLQIGGESFNMTETPAAPRVYTLPPAVRALYAVGDTATVTVPGVAGGFPGGRVSVRLSEPVMLGSLAEVVPGQSYLIIWATNGDQRSGIVISMRYAAGAAAQGANQQVLCNVRDDGAYTFQGAQLLAWASSNALFRSINVLRWRSNTAAVDARSTLYIVSTIDTTATSAFNAPQ